MEEELAKHLKQLADQFHGLAPVKCRGLAFEYVESASQRLKRGDVNEVTRTRSFLRVSVFKNDTVPRTPLLRPLQIPSAAPQWEQWELELAQQQHPSTLLSQRLEVSRSPLFMRPLKCLMVAAAS
ncbi:unnamed protein product [Pleuronectes platessa]|uniref:Uncharacterized protein n=1 Tax=Pleuronectes platessa TaxID=8262 RepID=A0A9N7VEY6_PLEPL|nr:unnamed protein product [Pleuronectes platessa]